MTIKAKNSFYSGTFSGKEFTVRSIYDTNYIDEGTGDATAFTLTPNTFSTTPTFSPDSGVIVGDEIALTLSATTTNRILSSTNNGSLVITLPSEMSTSSCTCSAEVSSSALDDCAVSSRTITVKHTSTIAAGSTIEVITSDCVTVQGFAGPTSAGIAFASYYDGAVSDS